jgi:hypothetical protein
VTSRNPIDPPGCHAKGTDVRGHAALVKASENLASPLANASETLACHLVNASGNQHRAKCGVLSPGTSDEKPLALREACNKVLHAEVRNFEWVSDFGSEIPELSGEVYLSGEQPDGGWKARLDIVGFVTAVASLTGGGSDEAGPAGE